MSDALPKGWATTLIADVTEQVPNIKPEDLPEMVFAYVDISAIDNAAFSISEIKRFKGKDAPSRARRPIQPNDVLFSNVRTYLRNVALVSDECPAHLCSTGFTVLRSNGAIEPRFLFRYVLTTDFIDRVTPQQTGTHYPATSDRVVISETIALPPLGEQRRIVAKLETLLGKVDACQRRLAKIPRLLKRFRQSVLAAACSGRLTADWRAQNSASSAPPRDKKDSRGGAENAEESEGVPESWETTELGTLTSLVTSGSRGWAEYYADTGSVFIRAQDINSDFLKLDGIAHVELPSRAEGQRTRVQQHDILITITGANVTKSAPVTEPLGDAYVSQHVSLVRLKNAQLSPFIFLCVISPAHGRKQLLEAAYGQGKPGLNLSNIRNLHIPLPPLPEQREIVRRVEQLFTFADQLEARYAKAQAHVDKLTQSLLAKAFRGELVPQDPNDEPASALLARIRSETNGAEKPARRKAKA